MARLAAAVGPGIDGTEQGVAAAPAKFVTAGLSPLPNALRAPGRERRVTYRRQLEIQARLLGKLIQGELSEYPVFVTR